MNQKKRKFERKRENPETEKGRKNAKKKKKKEASKMKQTEIIENVMKTEAKY